MVESIAQLQIFYDTISKSTLGKVMFHMVKKHPTVVKGSFFKVVFLLDRLPPRSSSSSSPFGIPKTA